MSDTLAQKHHCEFCCGVHRLCTKQSLQTDRKDLLTQRELQSEVCFLRPCSEECSDVAMSVIKIVKRQIVATVQKRN